MEKRLDASGIQVRDGAEIKHNAWLVHPEQRSHLAAECGYFAPVEPLRQRFDHDTRTRVHRSTLHMLPGLTPWEVLQTPASAGSHLHVPIRATALGSLATDA